MIARFLTIRNPLARTVALAAAALLFPALGKGQGSHNPASKFYVADVEGTVRILTGDRIDDLRKQTVYNAEGTVIETTANSVIAIVFSNGTGIYFDNDTRLEVKRFEQEAFVPNRSDMDTEPSVSQMEFYLPRGSIALSTSKLVPGSTISVRTPLGSINIRGGRVVIQIDRGVITVSVLGGNCTVFAGIGGGEPVNGGEQVVITPGAPGAPPQVTEQNIPSGELAQLEGRVTMAGNATRTVYFEARTGPGNNPNSRTQGAQNGPGTGAQNEGGGSNAGSGSVTVFDATAGNGSTTGTGGASGSANPQQVIVAIQVVPSDLPLQFDPSPNVVGNASGSP
ncbi:MAG: FecR domain-containing protein [Opitutaceae bacterium]